MRHQFFGRRLLLAAVFFGGMGGFTAVSASPYYYADYGDAPASYGGASTRTGDYQRLGNQYGVDDGVSWSVDGGATYGHAAAAQGQTVKFKFDLFSHNIGGHLFDAIRAWFDFSGDGKWSSNEMILSNQYNKASNAPYTWKGTPDNPGSNRVWANGKSDDWIKTSFFTEITLSDTAKIGDTWLRARATCDASLGGSDAWSNQAGGWQAQAGDITKLVPTGFTDQGEIEDYVFSIVAKSSSSRSSSVASSLPASSKASSLATSSAAVSSVASSVVASSKVSSAPASSALSSVAPSSAPVSSVVSSTPVSSVASSAAVSSVVSSTPVSSVASSVAVSSAALSSAAPSSVAVSSVASSTPASSVASSVAESSIASSTPVSSVASSAAVSSEISSAAESSVASSTPASSVASSVATSSASSSLPPVGPPVIPPVDEPPPTPHDPPPTTKVPEPSAFLLLALGLLGVFGARRRLVKSR